MSQPPTGDFSVRTLAEILREHGLESEQGTRPGRRRRQPGEPATNGGPARVDPERSAPARPAAGRPEAPGRAPTPPRTPARGAAPSAAPQPSTPPSVPPVSAPPPSSAPASRAPAPRPAPRTPGAGWRDGGRREAPSNGSGLGQLAGPGAPGAPSGPASTTGPVAKRAEAGPPSAQTGRRWRDAEPAAAPPRVAKPVPPEPAPVRTPGPSTAAIPALQTSSGTAAVGPNTEERRRVGAHRTGPQPTVAADGEPLTGRQSALAWLRFAGEMVVALAVGIGVYFAFTVLWELVPYGALVAAPLTITGLVAGVSAYRQKRGEGPPGVWLLAGLLLAAAVLVIAPAAGLLATP
ncbi:hypothetical protein [Modestobacter marinus]|uniref:hypothetical protein n=1 Tax=Modestobacter marinus TaxID=477641 RepID=UPI001C96B639|nr:hypothetical protein [Modestobacter marinus]